jgi:putative transposase
VPDRIKEPLILPEKLNESWSMDFLSDNLVDGRRFRILNITKMITIENP